MRFSAERVLGTMKDSAVKKLANTGLDIAEDFLQALREELNGPPIAEAPKQKDALPLAKNLKEMYNERRQTPPDDGHHIQSDQI